MSIAVDLDKLAAAVDGFGFAYLLTVSDDQRAHAVAATPEWVHGDLVMDVGRRSANNAAARSNISLIWPPVEAGGYSLIVDGDASVVGSTVTFTPERAVLHRPAPAPVSSGAVADGACGSDCQPV